ncbi:AMP-binding enzyme family protein [Mycobacteroides abscessus MAB_030201_1075]|uniref:AMP-binding enzyme family protein n=1 Tax=Mycobacteroides abscessus MAB_030201_1075 TaxID=1335410 RepID=A0A829PUZ7_9MYCO|nr:o-succinylbenzoate--CoA ligase [Mycobacteroides abscessus]ETZ91064.1 AMP-binding enzyme family protein [Mycobacteroides abscessus MAB_030201_1075]ETZ94370.1 AMP-binding enzyme family protein [Mycobacteroides abscessus MAB_030201_1061]EIC66941.1 O-succinylbenzoic acid--CoA ligase [Mycobacteroides abscessus M93]ETZ74635.1 AMP-binding enzyme family protein [Mycobacteroides abscessus MAB_110811_1470]MBN7410458.1 o-succinylbenzoate--CoA ligase [Mycobacteroides abscessus subsp. abscessus]
MTRLLRALPVPSGQTVLGLLPRLAELLDGRGDAVLPVPADDADHAHFLASELSADEPIADDVAVVISTSGTTGKPKGAMLTGQALTASGTATATRLGGPGQWLLALPPHHIAGMQVLLRSIQAGNDPVVLDVSTGFSVPDFVRAVAEMTGSRRYISLVATQLVKALGDAEASEALASFDAVLLGGGPLPATVAIRAAQARVPVVRTYGMSETCGGCVYDGVALDGVEVRIGPEGRISLGGATVAAGYRNIPEHKAFAEHGWFHTDDFGELDEGRLRVLGRLDEAISTGGLTVVPQVVEAALGAHPLVAECAVFGVPDDRLGQRVAAAVVPSAAGAPTLEDLREHVTAALDGTAAPRELHLLDELPRRGIGKLDRRALVKRFS